MFSFVKKKPFLKDLIPDGYTDIHSHLLPGIDDGAKTLAHTIRLLAGLEAIGCNRFITTPHVMKSIWDNTRDSINLTCAETVQTLESHCIKKPMRAAAEYLLDSNFAEMLKSEPLLTLKDNYVLVEMSYISPPIQLYEILFDLQIAGYIPVLAHPERYGFNHNNFSEYGKLKNAGCKFQLNLLSTVGYYGEGVFRAAEKLLKDGLIDFVGSDAHHDKHVESFSKRIQLKDELPLKKAIENNGFFNF